MKKRVFLFGGYSKAKSLAVSLLKRGYAVTAINSDRQNAEILAQIPALTVYEGDATSPRVLEDANLWNADFAIALTDYDADNLVACLLAKRLFNVQKTFSLITNPEKTELFHDAGVDTVVCAITSLTAIIEQTALVSEISTLVPLGDGSIKISQIVIPENAAVSGEQLMNLAIPKNAVVGCVIRGDKGIIPRGDTVIRAGDTVVLIAERSDETKAIALLTATLGAPA